MDSSYKISVSFELLCRSIEEMLTKTERVLQEAAPGQSWSIEYDLVPRVSTQGLERALGSDTMLWQAYVRAELQRGDQ